MAYRHLARNSERFTGPTAPRKRHVSIVEPQTSQKKSLKVDDQKGVHPLTNLSENHQLRDLHQKNLTIYLYIHVLLLC